MHTEEEQKRELAKKLVELTVSDPKFFGGDVDKDKKKAICEQFREEQIKLRIKHFDLKQLTALIDFYSTDMGASILISQRNISEDIGLRLETGSIEDKTKHLNQNTVLRSMNPESRDNGK